MKIDISAIIVTYNSQNEIKDCIESLYNNTQKNIEIFIIDNCSTDNTIYVVKQLQTIYHSLHLIESEKNLGLARGNNLPIKSLQGKYTLVVNPDAQALEYAIDKLYDKLEHNPHIGMIGPLCLSDDFKYHSSFHRNYGLLHILSWRILPYSIIRKIYDDFLKYRIKEGKVNFVSGEFYLTPTKLFQQVEGYDNYYFLSICDVADLAQKFKKVGFINYFYPDAKIFHPGGKSNSQVKLLTQIKGVDGELYFLNKNFNKISAEIARYSFLIYYLFRKYIFILNYKIFSHDKTVFNKLKIAHVLVGYIKNYNYKFIK